MASYPSTAVNAMEFSPDGRLIAVAQENNVELLDTHTGGKIAAFSGHGDAIRALTFAPDSGLLASVSNDRRVICWDVRRRKMLWSAVAHENRAAAAAFHPTLPTLATAGEDGMVRFWRPGPVVVESASRLVGEFPLDRGGPKKIAFSPDGRSLVISHRRNGISVLTASPLPSR